MASKSIYFYEDPLPLAVPLPKRGYSLEADMLLGWRPKFMKTPILLYYNDELYPDLYKKSCPTVFQGYRPKDSFAFHKELTDNSPSAYPYDFSDKSLTAYNFLNKAKVPIQDFHGMVKEAPLTSLRFDSLFEGGNLDQAVMISPGEYDLYMRPDTNTSGHTHWFYFSVTNFRSLATVKFNIVNFSRNSPLFKAGMRPKGYSAMKVQNGESGGWEYIGENVSFGGSKINKLLEPGTKKSFYSLSFEFKPYSLDDKLWLATTTPYTFSRLWKVIRHIKRDSSTYQLSNIKISHLGKSLSLVDIPMITITNPHSKLKKKAIIAIGRVHPSETVGSFVIEGFFRFLASRNPDARKLRDKFIFKIVPMCNPDGVIIGNSRTGLSGDDLNRCYLNPSEKLQPEAKLIKDMVEKLTEAGVKVYMFVDFHGHFCKKGAFMYGPAYPLHDLNYFQSRIVPKLLSERTPIFRYHSSRFIVERAKKSTARMVMWKELGIVNAYTLETSYYGYLNHDRETAVFYIEDFYILAENLARTIYEFYIMHKQERKMQKMKAKERQIRKQRFIPKSREEAESNGLIGDLESDESPFESMAYSLDTEQTSQYSKTPAEMIIPLNIVKEEIMERNLEEVIQMIKQDCSEGEESESEGSGSDSEEIKETVELPPLEKSRRNMSTEENNANKSMLEERKGKKKWVLNEKFAKRLQQIREKRKQARKKREKQSLPSIISHVQTNRIIKMVDCDEEL
jgi:cytosolic carboxypeptidase protein 2/3